jgi:hypothetical protein
MFKSFERRVRRLEQRRAKARPDFTGWTDEEILLWAARNYGYAQIVATLNERWCESESTVGTTAAARTGGVAAAAIPGGKVPLTRSPAPRRRPELDG